MHFPDASIMHNANASRSSRLGECRRYHSNFKGTNTYFLKYIDWVKCPTPRHTGMDFPNLTVQIFYTSTTPADLISSTTRSRDTYRIPASVLDLSNEFTQPFPSPEHSSQYSSTYMNHVNFRYQNIPQPPPLSPNPIPPATGPPYVPDSPTSSNTLKRPRWDNQTKWPLWAFNVNSRRLHPTPPLSESPIVHMLTRTMVLQKKPQYNTWHRTTTVRWLYSILVSRYPSSATIWRLKMKCFDIRWEINFYQKTFRSQIFPLGTRDHSEFYKHASVFALNTNTNQMA